ncbi:MAG: hypothetical protein GEV06_21230 [Luteitalea sp.]|nr:hypothetical protein [Luteitalea sp.]
MSDHSRSTPRSDLFPCTGRAILLLVGIWIIPTLSLTDQVRLLTAAERVLDGEVALVGAYSREGIHHPGHLDP